MDRSGLVLLLDWLAAPSCSPND